MKFNYDVDSCGNLAKSDKNLPTGRKETPTGSITQFAGDKETMERKTKNVKGKDKTSFTHTTYDPEQKEVEVRDYSASGNGIPGVTKYPTHYAGKENKALPKKSFSSDDVTVARLLKGKSPEEIQNILESLGISKAVSSAYTTSGALSSKRSGGPEGVKLLGEIDKHRAGKPSELDPDKKPTTGVSGKPASGSNVYSPKELVNRKVNPKGLEGLKRLSGSTMKSVFDICDDIMEKAKGTQPKDRSLLEGPYSEEAHKKYEARKPAVEAHAAKTKANIEATGRAVAHFRSKADEGFGDESEKSYSLDFNKSILERMGLEKGRKSAWESKGQKEDSNVRVPHSSDSSAGNLNPHTESRIQGIREVGEHENLKRMAASKDPSDVKYAKKKGYSLD